MKARLLREESTPPTEAHPGAWQCPECAASGSGPALKKCPECGSVVGQRLGRLPAGTIIDHPEAWKLVKMGVAIPADDECEKRAGMNAAQLAAAQVAQEKTRAGIAPEDYEAFEQGLMVGYEPDGSWKPGLNYEEYAQAEARRNSSLILEDE